jgi:hypothetical protein
MRQNKHAELDCHSIRGNRAPKPSFLEHVPEKSFNFSDLLDIGPARCLRNEVGFERFGVDTKPETVLGPSYLCGRGLRNGLAS